MYKSSLQEYCQSKKWQLPEYSTIREGLDHCPQFKASVTVNGSTFTTPNPSKSSKVAHNLVAQIAFHHLTGSSSASSGLQVLPTFIDAQQPKTNEPLQATSFSVVNSQNRDDKKFTGSSSASTGLQVSPNFIDAEQPKTNEPLQATSFSVVNSPNRDDKKFTDMTHLYKNQLQIYAQKRNLNRPVYISEREGPPHACRFKCKVMLEEKTYESLEFFSTIKDAENAAAKAALMSISSDGTEEEGPGFFKYLLQELARKEYACLPSYVTTCYGPSHNPIFSSVVKINEDSFTGQEAKTKKLAEMNAAKVSYIALRERSYHQDTEAGQVVVKPEFHTNFDQNICGQNSSSAPIQAPSRSGVREISQPLRSSDVSSSHKKIKVFPLTPNMILPTGATVMHRDEKWVAVSMDSIHGNV